MSLVAGPGVQRGWKGGPGRAAAPFSPQPDNVGDLPLAAEKTRPRSPSALIRRKLTFRIGGANRPAPPVGPRPRIPR